MEENDNQSDSQNDSRLDKNDNHLSKSDSRLLKNDSQNDNHSAKNDSRSDSDSQSDNHNQSDSRNDNQSDSRNNSWLTIKETESLFRADEQAIRRHIRKLLLKEDRGVRKQRRVSPEGQEINAFEYQILQSKALKKWKVKEEDIKTIKQVIKEPTNNPELEKEIKQLKEKNQRAGHIVAEVKNKSKAQIEEIRNQSEEEKTALRKEIEKAKTSLMNSDVNEIEVQGRRYTREHLEDLLEELGEGKKREGKILELQGQMNFLTGQIQKLLLLKEPEIKKEQHYQNYKETGEESREGEENERENSNQNNKEE